MNKKNKNLCICCKKEISEKAIRCRACNNKIIARNQKSKYKNFRKDPICIDCKKKLTSHYALRCLSCSMKYIRKNKFWNTTKGKKMTEEQKLKISKVRKEKGLAKKENNGNWRNFKLKYKLYNAIKNLSEYNDWRKAILIRDDYTCKECKQRGYKLEVHHDKKSYKEIFSKFINEYNQFSVLEDKETLIRLAITYKDFWDLENGTTLCKKCHNLKRVIK